VAVTTSDTSFIYDPFDLATQLEPYAHYTVLRDDYPAYYNEQRDFWTLSRFEDVQAAARDWQTYSNTGGVELDDTQNFYPETFGPGIVINYDPREHTRIRKVVHKWFTPKSVKELEERIRRYVRGMLDELQQLEAPDLAEQFAWRLPVSTISSILGFPESDHPQLERLMYDFEARQSQPEQTDFFEIPDHAREAGQQIAEYIAAQIDRRREQPGDDLLSVMVAAESEGTLMKDEPRGLTFILVLAGIDTTACLISNGLHRLAELPQDRARFLQQPELLPPAIEELMRWESPIPGLARHATRGVEIHGETIPSGALVWLCFAAANRDERRFPNPDVLDFDREPQRHLVFGEGIHHCIGAPLARLESRVAFKEFWERFPNYEIVGPNERLHQHTTRGWTLLTGKLT
jgi:cytochrome P450